MFKKSQALFIFGGVIAIELALLTVFVAPTELNYLYAALLLLVGTFCNIWLFQMVLVKKSKTSISNDTPWNDEEDRMRTSLAIAEKIQKKLLPSLITPIKGLDIYAKCRPSDEIGGDFYQIIPLTSTQALISMGDVAGHGLPSAMVSIIVDTLLYAFMGEEDLSTMLAKMNTILYQRIDPTLFSTLLLLKWDNENQTMFGVSAGFGRFLHYQSACGEVSIIKGGGVALGMIENNKQKIARHQFQFVAGDVLVLYTDGIPEMRNSLGEHLGVTRLHTMVLQHVNLSTSEQIFDAVSQDILNFAGTAKLVDDVTLMIIRCVC